MLQITSNVPMSDVRHHYQSDANHQQSAVVEGCRQPVWSVSSIHGSSSVADHMN